MNKNFRCCNCTSALLSVLVVPRFCSTVDFVEWKVVLLRTFQTYGILSIQLFNSVVNHWCCTQAEHPAHSLQATNVKNQQRSKHNDNQCRRRKRRHVNKRFSHDRANSQHTTVAFHTIAATDSCLNSFAHPPIPLST